VNTNKQKDFILLEEKVTIDRTQTVLAVNYRMVIYLKI